MRAKGQQQNAMESSPGDEDVAVKLDEAASELESEWLGYRGDSIVLDVADDYERHVTSSRARERELHEQIDPRVFDVHKRSVSYMPRSLCCFLSPGRLHRDVHTCNVRREAWCPQCPNCKVWLAPLRVGVALRYAAVWIGAFFEN